MMKKALSLILAMFMLAALMVACVQSNPDDSATTADPETEPGTTDAATEPSTTEEEVSERGNSTCGKLCKGSSA